MDFKKKEEWTALAKVYDPLKAGSIDGTDTDPHDRGIVRAMSAKYRPNKNIEGDPLYTIFVSSLSPKTTESDLKVLFSNYGEIRRLRLVRDIVTGFSKGYAFVEYEGERSAKKACRDHANLFIDGKQLFVDFEVERTLHGWIPRRFGGGFGGKKEAGQLRFGGLDRPHRKPIIIANMGKPKFENERKLNSDRETERRSHQDRYSRERPSRSRSSERHKRRSRSRSRSRSRHSSSRRKH